MTMVEYIEEISFTLGGSVLELEISNDLDKCVKRALRVIKPKITTPAYKTVPFMNTINLSNCGVYSVNRVLRTNPYNGTIAQDLDVFSLASTYVNMTQPSNYIKRMLLTQQRNTISTDLEFIWDNNSKELHVSVNPPFPPEITIVYIPTFDSVEQVTEPFWEDLILRLATAYAKQVVGRIRSKYKLEGSQFSLDGDALVAEGTTEINDIISYLNANTDLAFPID